MIQNLGDALRHGWAGSAIVVALGVGAGGGSSPASAQPGVAEWLPAHNESAARMALTEMRPLAADVATFGAAVTPAPTRSPVSSRTASAGPSRLRFTALASGGNSAGYAFGYCTWWASHKRAIPWHGLAYQWWSMARAYGFAEGSTPRVGAIMVMAAGAAGASAGSGHVAYVEAVNADGSFLISEMNWYGAGGGWGKVDYRTITSMAGILGFIY